MPKSEMTPHFLNFEENACNMFDWWTLSSWWWN